MLKKRIIKTFISLSLVMIVFCSCGLPAADKSENDNTKTLTIKWSVVTNNGGVYLDQDSDIARFLLEKFNIKIDFESITEKNIITKLFSKSNQKNFADIVTAQSDINLYRKMIGIDAAIPIKNNSEILYSSMQEHKDILLYDSEFDDIYAVFGGFNSTEITANEGIFINENAYKELGSPIINNTKNFCYVLAKFAAGYSEKDADVPPVPIVFGSHGEGVETLEHLFNIYPVVQTPEGYKCKVWSENYTALIEFLVSISKIIPYCNDAFNVSPQNLYSTMKNASLIYIGKKEDVEKYNVQNYQNRYIPIGLLNEMTGRPLSENRIGNYMTFIVGTEKKEMAIKLLEYLISSDGKRLTSFGIENYHYTNDKGDIERVGWVKTELLNNKLNFIRRSGIGTIPFFSDIGFDEYLSLKMPYTCMTDDNVDMLNGIIPISREGISYSILEDSLYSLYLKIISLDIGKNQALNELRELKNSNDSNLINLYLTEK